MGRIKTTLIKRTARELMEKTSESFKEDFESNKKALNGVLPGKKMRNQIAGYIARLKKNTKNIISEE